MKIFAKVNIGKVYFLYLFFVLFLQIIGLNAKGGLLDTLWKAAVIAITVVYIANKSKFTMNRYLLIPVLSYIVSQFMAFAFYPSDYIAVSLTSFFTNVMVITAMVFLFFSFPYTCEYDADKAFSWFLNGFIALMLYAVVYNIIINPTAVLNVFSNQNVYQNMMSSFFDNKQTFGMFLFLALICTAFQYVFTNKKIYIVFMLVFALNLFICLSRTALLAAVVFLTFSGIFMLNKHRSYSKLLAFFAVVSLIFVLAVPQLRMFITEVVFDTDKTINARQGIWDVAFDTLTGVQAFLGYGEGASVTVLKSVATTQYAHNGIVHVLLTGGIIKLVLYIFSIIKSLHSITTIKKHNSGLAIMMFAALISIMVYSMGESIVLFDTSAPCVAATILCAGFPCVFANYYKTKMFDDIGEKV